MLLMMEDGGAGPRGKPAGYIHGSIQEYVQHVYDQKKQFSFGPKSKVFPRFCHHGGKCLTSRALDTICDTDFCTRKTSKSTRTSETAHFSK